MSWHVACIGSPSAIKQHLEKYGASISGESKTEFEAAKPHLAALVDLNSNKNGPCTLQLSANGHATWTGQGESRVTQYSTCSVEIKSVPFSLVTEEQPA